MHKIKLLSCGSYVLSPKISTKELNSKTYITTDNMLPNKEGIVEAKNIPKDITVTKFIKDDILLSNIRPYFKKIWLAEFEGGCSADVLVFRVNKNYNPIYIKYCLSQDLFFKYNMLGAKGSKMPRGDKNHILNFEIFDIDFSSQKSIAKTLLLLDNKIQLNNKINNELEKMTKELYDYWFIQFEFPDKNNRPYKTNNGTLVYNDILKRKIPKGWTALSLESRLNFDKGIEFGSEAYIESPQERNNLIRFYRVADMDNYNNSTYISKNLNNIKFLQPNDLAVSFDGSPGKVVFGLQGAYSSGIRKITDKLSILKSSVLLFIFKNEFIQKTIKQYSTGSNILHASSSIPNLFIPFNEKIYMDFQYMIEPIYKKLVINKQENVKLSSLREFLLPMLMNRQISVKN